LHLVCLILDVEKMKTVSIHRSGIKLNYRHKECKIIPMREYKSVIDEKNIDSITHLNSDRVFLENFNFIPVSIFLTTVFPIIYILVALDAIKSKMAKTRNLIFSLEMKHEKIREAEEVTRLTQYDCKNVLFGRNHKLWKQIMINQLTFNREDEEDYSLLNNLNDKYSCIKMN